MTFCVLLLQILLLDEPTAGSDPLSRHRVWNLLKERRSDRVILFSTQFMDEADILAGHSWFSFMHLSERLGACVEYVQLCSNTNAETGESPL